MKDNLDNHAVNDEFNFEKISDSVFMQQEESKCSIKKYLPIILIISGLIIGVIIGSVISVVIIKKNYHKEIFNPEIFPYGDSSNTTYIIGHMNPDTDSISSAIIISDLEKKLGNMNKLIPCRLGELNKETKFVLKSFNVEIPKLISSVSGANSVILTDHNEYAQSVKDLDSSKITIDKVYDHHAISGFKYPNPLNYDGRLYGSTCSILYQIYKNYNFEIPKHVAGLVASGIISDTILLKSVTTTKLDEKFLKEASQIAGIDYKIFGEKMLREYTNISDLNDTQVLDYDAKNYNDNDNCSHVINYRIGTISTFDVDEFLSNRKVGLLNLMKERIKLKKYGAFVYFIVDISNFNSYAFIEGNIKDLIKKAFKSYECTEYQPDVYFLKSAISRKKQIAPKIKEAINNNCIEELF